MVLINIITMIVLISKFPAIYGNIKERKFARKGSEMLLVSVVQVCEIMTVDKDKLYEDMKFV